MPDPKLGVAALELPAGKWNAVEAADVPCDASRSCNAQAWIGGSHCTCKSALRIPEQAPGCMLLQSQIRLESQGIGAPC